MKTITVTDEVYDFLKSCQEELLTQNNRHTAIPIFGFQVDKEVSSINENECAKKKIDISQIKIKSC